MLYYTPEVQANVADLDGFFDQVLSETNQGKILLRVYYRHSSLSMQDTKIVASPFA